MAELAVELSSEIYDHQAISSTPLPGAEQMAVFRKSSF